MKQEIILGFFFAGHRNQLWVRVLLNKIGTNWQDIEDSGHAKETGNRFGKQAETHQSAYSRNPEKRSNKSSSVHSEAVGPMPPPLPLPLTPQPRPLAAPQALPPLLSSCSNPLQYLLLIFSIRLSLVMLQEFQPTVQFERTQSTQDHCHSWPQFQVQGVSKTPWISIIH